MIKLLLVDDDTAILDLLKTILDLHGGFAVTVASSASAALALLAADEFEIVMTDVRMESLLAGFEVARVASRRIPRPVVVLLTASTPPAADWRSTGADIFLRKGPGALEIPEKISALLKSRNHPCTSVA